MKLTIVDPRIPKHVVKLKRDGEMPWGLLDYVSVNHIALHGTWTVSELLSIEELITLRAFTNRLERRHRHEVATLVLRGIN